MFPRGVNDEWQLPDALSSIKKPSFPEAKSADFSFAKLTDAEKISAFGRPERLGLELSDLEGCDETSVADRIGAANIEQLKDHLWQAADNGNADNEVLDGEVRFAKVTKTRCLARP